MKHVFKGLALTLLFTCANLFAQDPIENPETGLEIGQTLLDSQPNLPLTGKTGTWLTFLRTSLPATAIDSTP